MITEALEKAAGAKAASHRRWGRRRRREKTGAGRDRQPIRAHEGDPRGERHDCAHASERIEIDRLRLTHDRVEGWRGTSKPCPGLPTRSAKSSTQGGAPNGFTISGDVSPWESWGVIYESRPNVTSDVAAICLKTGNAVVLRGGSEALGSNRAIVAAIQSGFTAAGLPVGCVQLITSADRALVQRMLRLRDYIDVIIPRGGEGLIRMWWRTRRCRSSRPGPACAIPMSTVGGPRHGDAHRPQREGATADNL